MKTFIFITFIAIIFSIANLYNWSARKLWGLMGGFSVVAMFIITLLVVAIFHTLVEALQHWEILSFNFN